MSLSKIRELREKRAALAKQMQDLIPTDGTAMSKENRAKFDQIDADQKALKDQIDVMERANELEVETGRSVRPPNDPVGDQKPDAQKRAVSEYRRALLKHGAQALDKMSAESRAIIEDANRRFWDAFREYSLTRELSELSEESRNVILGKDAVLSQLGATGRMQMSDRERRDLGITTGSLGGYFVPQGFVYEIEQAMKWYGGMLESTGSIDTATGNPLPWPTDNDTTNTGELVGEGVQVSDQDVSIGHITFNAWKYSTKMVKVSIELLQDSAFDIESYLKEKFAIRLGRKLNTDYTLGSGSSQPNGLITAIVANNGSPQAWAAGSGPGIPLIAAGSSGNTGGSETGTTSIGSTDLFNLEHSVDKAYRMGAAYMMHDLTLRYIKTLLDKYGRPLWVPGLKDNAPDTINGYPFFVNNDMAQIAASNVTVAFGQLKKYMRRNVKELAILRLVERFADYGQVAFIGFARKDGQLLDAGTHPVNYLIQHS